MIGSKASITANMPPAGYVFDRWVVNEKTTIDADGGASATLVMPASDVTVTATYRTQ